MKSCRLLFSRWGWSARCPIEPRNHGTAGDTYGFPRRGDFEARFKSQFESPTTMLLCIAILAAMSLLIATEDDGPARDSAPSPHPTRFARSDRSAHSVQAISQGS